MLNKEDTQHDASSLCNIKCVDLHRILFRLLLGKSLPVGQPIHVKSVIIEIGCQEHYKGKENDTWQGEKEIFTVNPHSSFSKFTKPRRVTLQNQTLQVEEKF